VLACCAFIFYIVHTLRKQFKVIDKAYLNIFGPILRKHEVTGLPGEEEANHILYFYVKSSVMQNDIQVHFIF